ncbi:S8 family serine peptidase [Achromobacter spanius]|uniref:S8 family serine peptidase n=1 Tax=Achromobacter spanius TaxID=217203 RepID=UPI003F68E37E
MKAKCSHVLAVVLCALACSAQAGTEGVVDLLRSSGKVGDYAMQRIERAQGERVELDISFNLQSPLSPFYRPGLDDDPEALRKLQSALLERANVAPRGMVFDAGDIGVMTLMLDAKQALSLAEHPNVRAIGALPPMKSFVAESASLSNFHHVWDAGFNGSGVPVAVIDNGFSPGHPAMNSVGRQYCYCTNSGNGCCAGGLHSASGVGAANYIGSDTGAGVGEGEDIHGTSVFAALWQNSHSVVSFEQGLARSVTPVLLNIAGTEASTWSGGYTSVGFKAALQSMRNGFPNADVRVINISFGWLNHYTSVPCVSLDTDATTTVIDSLHAEGKTIIVAAGNQANDFNVWPACLTRTIAVAAAWNKDTPDISCTGGICPAGQLAWYTNVNAYIDLAAAGSAITLARSQYNSGVYTHSAMGRNGTSFAAPTVAACAALLKQAVSILTPEAMRTALKTSPTLSVLPSTGYSRPLLNCAHAFSNVNAPKIPLGNAGLSGAWYEPRTAGQGFYLNLYPSAGVAWAGWFTFDTTDTTAQGRRWYTLQNATPFSPSATQTTLSIIQTTGGNFNAPPPLASGSVVGSATLSFTSCLSGTLQYSFSDGRNGTIPLTRLDNPFCSGPFSGDVAYTGLWHNPALPGQGLFFRVTPATQKLIGAWFTFDPAGSGSGAAGQEWYTIDNGEPGLGRPPGTAWNSTTKSAGFVTIATTGGLFNSPAPVPTRAIVGGGSVQFTSCTTATLTYNFADGRTGTIPLTRVGPAPGSC